MAWNPKAQVSVACGLYRCRCGREFLLLFRDKDFSLPRSESFFLQKISRQMGRFFVDRETKCLKCGAAIKGDRDSCPTLFYENGKLVRVEPAKRAERSDSAVAEGREELTDGR